MYRRSEVYLGTSHNAKDPSKHRQKHLTKEIDVPRIGHEWYSFTEPLAHMQEVENLLWHLVIEMTKNHLGQLSHHEYGGQFRQPFSVPMLVR